MIITRHEYHILYNWHFNDLNRFFSFLFWISGGKVPFLTFLIHLRVLKCMYMKHIYCYCCCLVQRSFVWPRRVLIIAIMNVYLLVSECKRKRGKIELKRKQVVVRRVMADIHVDGCGLADPNVPKWTPSYSLGHLWTTFTITLIKCTHATISSTLPPKFPGDAFIIMTLHITSSQYYLLSFKCVQRLCQSVER